MGAAAVGDAVALDELDELLQPLSARAATKVVAAIKLTERRLDHFMAIFFLLNGHLAGAGWNSGTSAIKVMAAAGLEEVASCTNFRWFLGISYIMRILEEDENPHNCLSQGSYRLTPYRRLLSQGREDETPQM